MDDVKLYVQFTIGADNDVQLSNASGDSYVIANGQAYPNTLTKVVGTYTVSNPVWYAGTEGAYSDNDYSADVINSLGAANYTVTMQASANVILQAVTAGTTKTNGFSATAVDHKFTLHVAAGGDLSIVNDPAATNMTIDTGTAKGQFNIRATDTDTVGTTLSKEADHTDTISVASVAKIVG